MRGNAPFEKYPVTDHALAINQHQVSASAHALLTPGLHLFRLSSSLVPTLINHCDGVLFLRGTNALPSPLSLPTIPLVGHGCSFGSTTNMAVLAQSCGDVLTKKKLDSHRGQCRGASFTCLDCMTHFHGSDYKAHTVRSLQCEAQLSPPVLAVVVLTLVGPADVPRTSLAFPRRRSTKEHYTRKSQPKPKSPSRYRSPPPLSLGKHTSRTRQTPTTTTPSRLPMLLPQLPVHPPQYLLSPSMSSTSSSQTRLLTPRKCPSAARTSKCEW